MHLTYTLFFQKKKKTLENLLKYAIFKQKSHISKITRTKLPYLASSLYPPRLETYFCCLANWYPFSCFNNCGPELVITTHILELYVLIGWWDIELFTNVFVMLMFSIPPLTEKIFIGYYMKHRLFCIKINDLSGPTHWRWRLFGTSKL